MSTDCFALLATASKFDVPDKDGKTVLHDACNVGYEKVISALAAKVRSGGSCPVLFRSGALN
jgi:hypothetical protein